MGYPINVLDGIGRIRLLADIEQDAIERAVTHSGGCKAKAAAALGIGRSTLYRKLKEYKEYSDAASSD